MAPSFDEVFREHLDYVWRIARMLSDDAVADDLAQEVFLVVRRKLPSFDGVSLRAWLYGITRNVARNYERGRRRQQRMLAALPSPGPAPAPDEAYEREEAADLMDTFLHSLSPAKRDAFALHVIEGLTAAEIAQTIGVPDRTIYSRVRAAKAALAEFLARHERRQGRGA